MAARLCVLVDGRETAAAFERLVDALFAAGVGMIQVRDKSLPVPVLVERVRLALMAAARHDPASPPLVIVNDRADVAAAVGAGVHLGRDDLPIELARRLVGPAQLVGRTAHDLGEARGAAAADYLGVGPCFASTTKRFEAQADRGFLRTVAAEAPVPVFAIGGVTPDRLPELAALGIGRVAVAAAVTGARDPGAAAREFLERLSG